MAQENFWQKFWIAQGETYLLSRASKKAPAQVFFMFEEGILNMCSKRAQEPWPPGELHILSPHDTQPPQLQARGWVWGQFSRVASSEDGTGAWSTSPSSRSASEDRRRGHWKMMLTMACSSMNILWALQNQPSKTVNPGGPCQSGYALSFIQENCVHALQRTLKLCKYQQAICCLWGFLTNKWFLNCYNFYDLEYQIFKLVNEFFVCLFFFW